MSLVKERPVIRRANARPVRRTQPASRVRHRPERRPRSGAVTRSFVLVGAVALASFVASSVIGNTLLESARRDRLHSVERTKGSLKEVARLRRALDGMSSMSAVSRYAQAQGLELSGAPAPRNETVVAQLNPNAQAR